MTVFKRARLTEIKRGFGGQLLELLVPMQTQTQFKFYINIVDYQFEAKKLFMLSKREVSKACMCTNRISLLLKQAWQN